MQFVDDAFGVGAGGVSGTAGVKWLFDQRASGPSAGLGGFDLRGPAGGRSHSAVSSR